MTSLRQGAALLILALVLMACSSQESSPEPDEPSSAGTPVIFSTDMAMGLDAGNANGTEPGPSDFDDSYAYALAMESEDLDLRGVVATMGNNQVQPEMTTAAQTISSMSAATPLLRGADVPLPVVPVRNYDGDSMTSTCVNEGVEFMAEELRTDRITMVAIGPLTDLACLALNFPEEATNIEQIVALVGSKPKASLSYDGTPITDFNYVMDPRAEYVLLEQTEIPFKAIMFELSSSVGVSLDRVRALKGSDSARGRYFGEASSDYAEFWEKTFGDTKPIWDATVVWGITHPEDYHCYTAGFRLSPTPEESATQTASDPAAVYDWFSPDYQTRQVQVCDRFNEKSRIAEFNDAVFAAVQ